MSLPIDRERAAGGDLARGDRVDVVAVVEGRALYVAADLEVLAVASSRGDGALAAPGRFFVTVAVDEPTALALARALEIGTVSVLRSTGSLPATVDPDALRGLSDQPGPRVSRDPPAQDPPANGQAGHPQEGGDDAG
ncbi:MAG TPA: hypothetical protein VM324_16225 [Egibacteraceae bacterium]|nr:hypothetical protein [Egibacteraceae bacterium]